MRLKGGQRVILEISGCFSKRRLKVWEKLREQREVKWLCSEGRLKLLFGGVYFTSLPSCCEGHTGRTSLPQGTRNKNERRPRDNCAFSAVRDSCVMHQPSEKILLFATLCLDGSNVGDGRIRRKRRAQKSSDKLFVPFVCWACLQKRTRINFLRCFL